MAELDGAVVIVTGSGSGIGEGIATVLADRGARVVVADLDEMRAKEVAQAIADAGGTSLAVQHDVTSGDSCAEMVRQVTATFGGVNGLVNNAGISNKVSFAEMDEAEWDRMIRVNLKGVFLTTRAVVGHMINQRHGRIVNISSFVGLQGIPLFSHYCASKFGVIGLTQSLAVELAEQGITVNAVLPGVVRTRLWGPLLEKTATEQGVSIDQAWQDAVAPIPLGRPQEPADIGEAVAFLLSEAGRNITGATINVTGGQLLH